VSALSVVWARRPAPVPERLLGVDVGFSRVHRFHLARPAAGESVTAVGVAASLEASGPERFPRLCQELRSQRERLVVEGPDPVGGALWVGGFGFSEQRCVSFPWSGFPAMRFVLPRVWILRRGADCFWGAASQEGMAAAREQLRHALRLRGPQAGGFVPTEELCVRVRTSAAEYRAGVSAAMASIRAGDLRKVVLARELAVSCPQGFDAGRLLCRLAQRHPACAAYRVGYGDLDFVGASPERLVRVEAGTVYADALAGSAPRGLSPLEDSALARELVESKKQQEEHALVVDAIRAALNACCREVRAPEAPRLLATAGIQHLHTPFQATRGRASALEVAARLHPTPAVAGTPRAAAQTWLRTHERFERGWYSGALGWLGASGEGELVVALRGALLAPGCATLHAGNGLVADSEPFAEWAETGLKLRSVLDALLEI